MRLCVGNLLFVCSQYKVRTNSVAVSEFRVIIFHNIASIASLSLSDIYAVNWYVHTLHYLWCTVELDLHSVSVYVMELYIGSFVVIIDAGILSWLIVNRNRDKKIRYGRRFIFHFLSIYSELLIRYGACVFCFVRILKIGLESWWLLIREELMKHFCCDLGLTCFLIFFFFVAFFAE